MPLSWNASVDAARTASARRASNERSDDVEARGRAGELALELEHALSTRATLAERRPQEKEGAEGADEEADEECDDRHEGEGR